MFKKTAIFMMVLVFQVCVSSDVCRSIDYIPKKSTKPVISSFIVKDDVREWALDLNTIGFDGVDPTTLNRDLLMNWLYQVVEKKVNRSPKSAYFSYRSLVPHVMGRTIRTEKVEEWLDHIHQYINHPMELPMDMESPALTSEELRSCKKKRLATYTTRFNPFDYGRSLNIKISGNVIDHYIVMPGKTFSFNEVIGRTTSRKGYRAARIIVNGEYKKGLGGGICQTSSTLFNCVDRAGLRIVERTTHSKPVFYVPKNRDATVSLGGPDFKFKNQLDQPIVIVSDVTYGKIRISIYSSESVNNHPRYVPSLSAD